MHIPRCTLNAMCTQTVGVQDDSQEVLPVYVPLAILVISFIFLRWSAMSVARMISWIRSKILL